MQGLVRFGWAAVVMFAAGIGGGATARPAQAQGPRSDKDKLIESRNNTEKELELAAIIERKVMVPMRDGKRMQADIYRPKDTSKKYPIIFVRTPYNFNYWDIELGSPRDMTRQLEAVQHGYAYVEMNERGRYFSEGDYDILGVPLTDSDDELDWMGHLPWSSGKVGLIGCSSTAEWQLAVAARGNPSLATFIPEGFGAGVGRVGPYYEQGNWFRGGAVQMLFATWLYDYGLQTNDGRPNFPSGMSQQALITAARQWDLDAHPPAVNWTKALWHLPEKDILLAVSSPHGIYADPTPSGLPGLLERTPSDPAWLKGGLWNDSMRINIPGLWMMSWYDVSVGPNLAAYNFVRKTASPDLANEQYAIIAPVSHCAYERATEHTIVGERDMGDARLPYDDITFSWFDRFLKGKDNGTLEKTPKIRYYTMGSNKWQSSDTWPPEGVKPMTLYLSSKGHANSLNGDGALLASPGDQQAPDQFVYDPMNPVLTVGGGFCCMGADYKPGAFDQRGEEAREDVLVYSTRPLQEGLEVTGPVDVTLFVSSNAKDTDFTYKIDDVLPDGKAYNIVQNIQRMRYREGYDKPPMWMEKDKVYKVQFQPMQTSNYFAPGHELRVEITSSNFPRFDRNLNTGGDNVSESEGVVAHNEVHHSREYPSSVTLSVMSK
jgi:uncharacterized protein